MEMLVVLAIFSTVAVMAVDIFFIVTRTQHRVAEDQQVQGDVRFTVDTIGREIQQDAIDYAYYGTALASGSQPVPQAVLALRDAGGQAVRFQAGTSAQGIPTVQVCKGACTTWQPLMSDAVRVAALRFYVVPASDPMAAGSPPNEYPRVTIVLSAQSAVTTQVSSAAFFLQTTVALRSYRR